MRRFPSAFFLSLSGLALQSCACHQKPPGTAVDEGPAAPRVDVASVVACFAASANADECLRRFANVSVEGTYDPSIGAPREAVVLAAGGGNAPRARLRCAGWSNPRALHANQRYLLRGQIRAAGDLRKQNPEDCGVILHDLIAAAACEEAKQVPLWIEFADGCTVL